MRLTKEQRESLALENLQRYVKTGGEIILPKNEEETRKLYLTGCNNRKRIIPIVKALREIGYMGLADAKRIVDSATEAYLSSDNFVPLKNPNFTIDAAARMLQDVGGWCRVLHADGTVMIWTAAGPYKKREQPDEL